MIKKICIVTNRHVCYNPRALKEADALHAHGYEVTVVTISNHEALREFDQELMRTRSWQLKTVNFCKNNAKEKAYWLFLSLKHKIFSVLARVTYKFGIAERSVNKAYDGLIGLARKDQADLYIVHHAEALGAGVNAARANNARLGFDAEDFHTGMNKISASEASITSFIEKKYLSQCDYLTAASKGIAISYSEKYGLKTPETILNSFPKEQLNVRKAGDPVRFYWYSQIIGPNRGLELLVAAAGKIGLPFEIHLRGDFHSEEYRVMLDELTTKAGIKDRFFFYGSILAEQIIGDANNFDIGLALETDISINSDRCVANKIFAYLMAGLAIIGTDTYGQKDIFTYFPGAVQMFRIGSEEELAAAMRFYISNPDKLWEAKVAARAAAETRFNWEQESQKLLAVIDHIS